MRKGVLVANTDSDNVCGIAIAMTEIVLMQ